MKQKPCTTFCIYLEDLCFPFFGKNKTDRGWRRDGRTEGRVLALLTLFRKQQCQGRVAGRAKSCSNDDSDRPDANGPSSTKHTLLPRTFK